MGSLLLPRRDVPSGPGQGPCLFVFSLPGNCATSGGHIPNPSHLFPPQTCPSPHSFIWANYFPSLLHTQTGSQSFKSLCCAEALFHPTPAFSDSHHFQPSPFPSRLLRAALQGAGRVTFPKGGSLSPPIRYTKCPFVFPSPTALYAPFTVPSLNCNNSCACLT